MLSNLKISCQNFCLFLSSLIGFSVSPNYGLLYAIESKTYLSKDECKNFWEKNYLTLFIIFKQVPIHLQVSAWTENFCLVGVFFH